jgi:hypothetical protein
MNIIITNTIRHQQACKDKSSNLIFADIEDILINTWDEVKLNIILTKTTN